MCVCVCVNYIYCLVLVALFHSLSLSLYIYIYIRGAFNKFPDIFVEAFKIINSWKFSMLLLYILWLNNFFDLTFKWTATAAIGIHPTKTDCHSGWISKMQSGREEERYAKKFCFKLGTKCHGNVWNASDSFSTILHELSFSFEWDKRFKEGRESVRGDERCGRSKEVRTPELIG